MQVLSLALLMLSCLLVGSQPSPYVNVSTDLFASPPVKVYDATNNTDFHSLIRSRTTLDIFSAGLVNDTLHLWAVYWDGIYIRWVNRRNLNATLLMACTNDTSEVSVIGDTLIETAILATSSPLFASCPGFLAIAAAGTTETSISILSSTDLFPTNVQLLVTQNASTLWSFWFQGGYFYLTWWSNNTIYLQGVSTDGNLLYTSAIIVATTPYSFSYNQYLLAGSSSCSDPIHIYIIYKLMGPGIVYTVQVNRKTGVVETPKVLVTDIRKHASQSTYWPAGVIGSCASTGIVISNASFTEATSWTYQFLIFFNDTFTSSSPDSGVTRIMSMNHPAGGYFNFATYYSGNGSKYEYAFQTFYNNGTEKSTQTFFATIISGSVNIFADSNGAIWFGYTSNFSSSYTQIGMIGKLFSKDQDPNYLLTSQKSVPSEYCNNFLIPDVLNMSHSDEKNRKSRR